MRTKIIEVTNGPRNWGKMLVGKMDTEWSVRSQVDPGSTLLRQCGWSPEHVWVLDLQTGEGAFFRQGGHAGADLQKHKIWVCPMYEPFLTWLYQQDLSDLDALPALVDFDVADAPFSFAGYRRPGPDGT